MPHKLHSYWLLEPDAVSVEEFSTLQTALIERFGGDAACKNLSRVMRVPGFLHTKAAPMLTTLLEANGQRYNRGEMLEAFPELPEALEREEKRKRKCEAAQERAKSRASGGGGKGSRAYAEAALRREHDRVAAAPEGTRNNILNKAAHSLGQLVGGGELERAEVEDVLRGAAATCGLDGHEVEATLKSGLEAGAKEPRTAPPPEPMRKKDLTGKVSKKEPSPKAEIGRCQVNCFGPTSIGYSYTGMK